VQVEQVVAFQLGLLQLVQAYQTSMLVAVAVTFLPMVAEVLTVVLVVLAVAVLVVRLPEQEQMEL
jgi:hypothetical protein